MILDNIIALTAFCLISSITPGPNNLMLMASGTNFGLARSTPHMLGICFGMGVMIALVWLGMGQVLETYPAAFEALKIVSSAYLVYLAWKIAGSSAPKSGVHSRSKPFSVIQAALFQWVNPKAWMMCLSIVTAYRLPFSPQVSLMVTLAIFLLIMLPSISCWVFMGANIRSFLTNPLKLKIFNWICALSLLATLYPILWPQ